MRYPTIHTSLKSFAGHALAGTAGVAALTLILSAAPAARAQQATIDTYGTGTGLTGVYFQGSGGNVNGGPATPTYGQTITATQNESLTSFTFYTANDGSDFTELAEVYAYDASTGTTSGGPLSTSNVTIASTAMDPAGTYLQDTVGNLSDSLVAGDTYVLEFTSVGSSVTPPVAATYATRYDDEYAGGDFVYNSTASTASGYNAFGGGDDLAFKATFAPAVTPEPGMVVTGLSMLSMTGLGLVRGRRRAKAAAKAA